MWCFVRGLYAPNQQIGLLTSCGLLQSQEDC